MSRGVRPACLPRRNRVKTGGRNSGIWRQKDRGTASTLHVSQGSQPGKSDRTHQSGDKKASPLFRAGFSPGCPAFFCIRLFIQCIFGWTVNWISAFGGSSPALANAMRRQGQLPGQGDVGTQQFFNDGIPDELRPVPVTRRPQPGVQFPEKFLVHRDRQ